MSVSISYTRVELCNYNQDISRSWFIYFDVTDNALGITVRKQFRGGINFYKTVKERTRRAEQLRKFWEERLKLGWSPFMHTGTSNLSRMRFNEALDWAMAKCEVAEKTKIDYKGTVGFFKTAAKKMGWDKAIITGINRQHIMLLLDQIKEDRNWSNHAYNKNAGYIGAVLSILEKYMVINFNPAHKIEMLPVAETDMFETITDDEKIRIKDHLTEAHPAFFIYLMCIYYTGIRPKECLALRLSDLHLERKLIIIKPDIKTGNSKTKTIRMVPLSNQLVELLKCHTSGYTDQSLFLFGSPNEKGNRGSGAGGVKGASRKEYFTPLPFSVKRDTATNLWKKMIWHGLGIHKYQYAMKHTGGDDKILAGLPLEALKTLYGHSSIRMTEKYAKKIKGVYNQQIIEGSPGF